MAQKGLMRILSRKDGKDTVSDGKENEKAKVTKVLEFVPARKPEQAKIGGTIRFMHNPGNGLSAYLMQGEIDSRVDKYNVAKESGFTRNQFKVKKLSIINHWGDKGTIPETLTVNLSKNTARSLGEEVKLRITEEDEVIMFEQSDVCGTNDDDDEVTGNKSVKDDENGATGRTKITPNQNESDSDSLAKIKMANNSHEDDNSTVISTISDDISEVRRMRTMHTSDWLMDERAQEVMEKVHTLVEQGKNKNTRPEAMRIICDTISAAQEGLDLAFAAGTLSTTACIAQDDSSRNKERHTSEDAKKAMVGAKAGLKRALEKVNNLEKDDVKQIRQWLENMRIQL